MAHTRCKTQSSMDPQRSKSTSLRRLGVKPRQAKAQLPKPKSAAKLIRASHGSIGGSGPGFRQVELCFEFVPEAAMPGSMPRRECSAGASIVINITAPYSLYSNSYTVSYTSMVLLIVQAYFMPSQSHVGILPIPQTRGRDSCSKEHLARTSWRSHVVDGAPTSRPDHGGPFVSLQC